MHSVQKTQLLSAVSEGSPLQDCLCKTETSHNNNIMGTWRAWHMMAVSAYTLFYTYMSSDNRESHIHTHTLTHARTHAHCSDIRTHTHGFCCTVPTANDENGRGLAWGVVWRSSFVSACLLIGRTLSVCQSVACSHYVCLPVGCVYICLFVRVPVYG